MKTKTLWEIAASDAAYIVDMLRPHCERIETAGSIRRLAREVGDIEIVAIPKPAVDMFGTPFPLDSDHALNRVDWEQFGVVKADGLKMKKIQLHEGMQLDLFIVTPPAQWGVIFTLRTGPAEFSHRLVTKKAMGGMMPAHLRMENGAIWHGEALIPTPEEEDVFRALDVPYIEPKDRT